MDKSYTYQELVSDDVTHFIALERPGAASDGNYYNHKGNTINSYHYPLDVHFKKAKENGVITIGIGDGGNELGLGNMYNYFKRIVTNGEKNCTIIGSDYLVLAGVSNWAGYALASLLKYKSKNNALYSTHKIDCLLTNIVKCGAVDGIRKKQTKTVDGLELGYEEQILEKINCILE